MRRSLLAASAACSVIALASNAARAFPLEVIHLDTPECDPLFVPNRVHELGIPPTFLPFPDELIEAASTFTQEPACPPHDSPSIPNALVVMTNLTGIAWRDVWYVADPNVPGAIGTSISNEDGLVDMAPAPVLPGQAFKIDTLGVNKPLVFESFVVNGIFEPGETWHFIIQDYINTGGLPAHLFDSLGVASASVGGPPSSGSIIAIPVPEPTTLGLLGAGAILALRRRK